MSYIEGAFITLLNMSITASYVAIAVMTARLLLKKAPKVFSYTLWSAVLFRLICPVSFSSGFSLLGLIQPVQTGMSSTQYIPQDIGMAALPTVDTGLDSVNASFNASLPAAPPFASVNPLQVWITLGTLFWLIGVAVLLIYAVISYLRLNKQISMATLVSDNIYETDRIRSPFVCGFVKPKIFLPLHLSGLEREYILRHERIHIKRLDYLVKPLAFLVLTLHWFNPILWLCYSLMTKDMEMSCDERVVQSLVGEEAASYCSSLLALARPKNMPAPIPLAFGESNVKARIYNVLNYKKPAFWVIMVTVIAILILSVALISNPVNVVRIAEKSDYNVEALLKNKTSYIGNNSRVVALIDALPLPEGVARETVKLETSKMPYGVTISYRLLDDSAQISEEQFLRNSLLLFALIDNADKVTHRGFWNNKLLSSIPFSFTYTRADAERVVGGDIRQFAENKERLTELLEIIQMLGASKKTP